MEDLLDMIIGDESASNISDKIKELIYNKSAEKIKAIRPPVSNSMFNSEDEDVE